MRRNLGSSSLSHPEVTSSKGRAAIVFGALLHAACASPPYVPPVPPEGRSDPPAARVDACIDTLPDHDTELHGTATNVEQWSELEPAKPRSRCGFLASRWPLAELPSRVWSFVLDTGEQRYVVAIASPSTRPTVMNGEQLDVGYRGGSQWSSRRFELSVADDEHHLRAWVGVARRLDELHPPAPLWLERGGVQRRVDHDCFVVDARRARVRQGAIVAMELEWGERARLGELEVVLGRYEEPEPSGFSCRLEAGVVALAAFPAGR